MFLAAPTLQQTIGYWHNGAVSWRNLSIRLPHSGRN